MSILVRLFQRQKVKESGSMSKGNDFLYDANNVYRTKNYIVKQVIGVRTSDEENNIIMSFDTYYRRTKKRDKIYERAFASKKHIDGKRLPSTMYSRKYIDWKNESLENSGLLLYRFCPLIIICSPLSTVANSRFLLNIYPDYSTRKKILLAL